jgi:hypothetical protein
MQLLREIAMYQCATLAQKLLQNRREKRRSRQGAAQKTAHSTLDWRLSLALGQYSPPTVDQLSWAWPAIPFKRAVVGRCHRI